jgi:hypothetical protein
MTTETNVYRYRKKPVVIEAFPWSPPGLPTVAPEWFHKAVRDGIVVDRDHDHTLGIKTLEGWHTAMPGDWIIRGIKGELYPCKPDIFEATYDPA